MSEKDEKATVNTNNGNQKKPEDKEYTVYDYFLMQQELEEKCGKDVNRYKREVYEFSFFAIFFIFIAIMCAVNMAYFKIVWFGFFIWVSIVCLFFLVNRLKSIRECAAEYKKQLKEVEKTLTDAGIHLEALDEDYKKFDIWTKKEKFKPKTLDELKNEVNKK